MKRPDLANKFPESKKALEGLIEVDLKEGESLYVPPFDWHYVESYGQGKLEIGYCRRYLLQYCLLLLLS
jgi:oxalate decarboxylase/phosphoglucose isomerase-like protein (cupin superfamily)